MSNTYVAQRSFKSLPSLLPSAPFTMKPSCFSVTSTERRSRSPRQISTDFCRVCFPFALASRRTTWRLRAFPSSRPETLSSKMALMGSSLASTGGAPCIQDAAPDVELPADVSWPWKRRLHRRVCRESEAKDRDESVRCAPSRSEHGDGEQRQLAKARQNVHTKPDRLSVLLSPFTLHSQLPTRLPCPTKRAEDTVGISARRWKVATACRTTSCCCCCASFVGSTIVPPDARSSGKTRRRGRSCSILAMRACCECRLPKNCVPSTPPPQHWFPPSV